MLYPHKKHILFYKQINVTHMDPLVGFADPDVPYGTYTTTFIEGNKDYSSLPALYTPFDTSRWHLLRPSTETPLPPYITQELSFMAKRFYSPDAILAANVDFAFNFTSHNGGWLGKTTLGELPFVSNMPPGWNFYVQWRRYQSRGYFFHEEKEIFQEAPFDAHRSCVYDPGDFSYGCKYLGERFRPRLALVRGDYRYHGGKKVGVGRRSVIENALDAMEAFPTQPWGTVYDGKANFEKAWLVAQVEDDEIMVRQMVELGYQLFDGVGYVVPISGRYVYVVAWGWGKESLERKRAMEKALSQGTGTETEEVLSQGTENKVPLMFKAESPKVDDMIKRTWEESHRLRDRVQQGENNFDRYKCYTSLCLPDSTPNMYIGKGAYIDDIGLGLPRLIVQRY